MRKLGCLIVIVLICVGGYYLLSAEGMTDEQKMQFVGEKAHRGWQEAHRMAEQARKGWDKASDEAKTRPAAP